MKTKIIPITLMCFPIALWAAPFELASFGGDYVTSNQDSQASLQDILGTPTASDSIRQIGGVGVTNNPAIGADYTGPAFNGGAQVVKFGVNANNGLATAQVIHDAGGDYVELFAQSPSGTTSSHLNVIFSMDVAETVYSDLTSFSGRTAGGVGGTIVSRFMVGTSDGDLYLSNTSISGGNAQDPWSISNLSTENWALFTPGANDWRGDFGSLDFNTVLGSQTITSVGWFASRDAPGGFTNSTLTIREFEVMAIPEPSTIVLLGITLGSLLVFRRRK